jgi:hypothetical protein
VKNDRSAKLTGDKPIVNDALIERTRQALGFKGYATSLPMDTVAGEQVIAA